MKVAYIAILLMLLTACGGSDSSETPAVIDPVPDTTPVTDSDSDSVLDDIDNCPIVSNTDQADFNDNGIGDACDDSDNDKVFDSLDNCPIISNAEQADFNANGIGDACDDSDADTIFDNIDNCPLVSNSQQVDLDGNGVGDACEDADKDTVFDSIDNCPLTPNTLQADFNDNGVGDACDDSDTDTVFDSLDNCPLIANIEQGDFNGNGVGDACEDSDKDTVFDVLDNCPLIANENQNDFNDNGVDNACDDSDNDSIFDSLDNCVLVANSNQSDFNGNGIGDVCDDSDSDLIIDSLDNCPLTVNPNQEDFNGNGTGDACDDSDSDTVFDDIDNCPITANLNQDDFNSNGIGDVCDDTDGDSIFDDIDNCPLIANPSQNDANGNGVGDACEAVNNDFDNDGISNSFDNCPYTANSDQADADSDGKGDACEPAVPKISMLFPAHYSATENTSITVRGSAINFTEIDSLEVNGVLANTTDNYANWTAVLPLSAGNNTLTGVITTLTENDTLQTELGSIESNALLTSPQQIVFSSDGAFSYILEDSKRRILKVDNTTGARTVLSSVEVPNEDIIFENLKAMAIDNANNRLLVLMRNHYVSELIRETVILAVDLDSGVRSIVSGSNMTPAITNILGSPDKIAFDYDNQDLYVLNESAGVQSVVKVNVDLNSGTLGEQTEISNNSLPNALNPIEDIRAISFDSVGKRLLLADEHYGDGTYIVAVNLDPAKTLGNRELLTQAYDWNDANSLVTGESGLAYVYDSISPNNNISDLTSDIYSVDLDSGVVNLLHGGGSQGKQLDTLEGPARLTYNDLDKKLYISSEGNNAIYSFDLETLERRVAIENLQTEKVGVTPMMDLRGNFAFDKSDSLLWFIEDNQHLYQLNLATLDVSLKYTFLVSEVEELSFDEASQSIIAIGQEFVWSFDKNSMAKKVIMNSVTGSGDPILGIDAWIPYNDEFSLFLNDELSGMPNTLYQVDMTTGNRTQITLDYSAAPGFERGEQAVLSADKKSLYTFDDDTGFDGVFAIDLASPDVNKPVTVIASNTVPLTNGTLLEFGDPESIAISTDQQFLYVADNSPDTVFKVAIADGYREDLLPDVVNRSPQQWGDRIQGMVVDNDKQVLYTLGHTTDLILMLDEVTEEWVVILE